MFKPLRIKMRIVTLEYVRVKTIHLYQYTQFDLIGLKNVKGKIKKQFIQITGLKWFRISRFKLPILKMKFYSLSTNMVAFIPEVNKLS